MKANQNERMLFVNSINSIDISGKLPKFSKPVSRTAICLDDAKLMGTIRLDGMPFESESSSSLESAFQVVKGFLNQLAKLHGSDLALWTHIVKRKDTLNETYSFDSEFVQSFADKYVSSFSGQRFYQTEYYITFVMKYKKSLEHALPDFEDLLKMAKSVLSGFNADILQVQDDGRCENVEFLAYLLNNFQHPMPITDSKVVDIIPRSDWHFGYDLLEIRNCDSQQSKYATFYELDGFPTTSTRGMWDFVLTQKSEFILTQSIILMKSLKAMDKLDSQINLISSGDNAEHELDEINRAKDYVSTGEISFGDYHCTLAVFGDSEAQAIEDGNELSSEFLANGTILKRSNLKSQFSFLAMMPDATKHRIKPAPRTTTTLSSTFSLHNYSTGKKTGNPIGDGTALMPLKSLSDTLFYLNCHASDLHKNVTGQKYAGHTMVLGASGTGKTTIEGTMTAFLTRFNPQIFAIDYNRSTELFIRAFGGEYFTIREGICTGLNPFQLNKTPQLVSFLNRLTYTITANNEGYLTEEEEHEIKCGIDTVLSMSLERRGLSMLLQSIQLPSLRARLSKWCRSANGSMAWCLDAAVNKFNPANMDRVGFDSTMLLEGEGHPASEVILGTLFYLKKLMQTDGRLMLTIVEEFWMPANFALTQDEMKKTLKAGRLKNEFMILSSQSPEDAINCAIFAAIVQQTATKLFLPNPDAEYDAYKQCNVTQGEFKKLKALSKTSRTFLVKQSNTSCFAKLDLHGFDDHLPIISGTDDDIKRCEMIRKKVGDKPENWIPEFQHYLKNKDNLHEYDEDEESNTSHSTNDLIAV
jgi:type IV secretion system protein VirB4